MRTVPQPTHTNYSSFSGLLDSSPDKLLRALTFSFLAPSYLHAHTRALSTVRATTVPLYNDFRFAPAEYVQTH